MLKGESIHLPEGFMNSQPPEIWWMKDAGCDEQDVSDHFLTLISFCNLNVNTHSGLP